MGSSWKLLIKLILLFSLLTIVSSEISETATDELKENNISVDEADIKVSEIPNIDEKSEEQAKAAPKSGLGLYFTYFCIISTSTVCVYLGAKKALDTKDEDSERMSGKDAAMFPIIASGALFGLYLAIQYISARYLTLLLSCYFVVIGSFAVARTIHGFIAQYFPSLTKTKHSIWVPSFIESTGKINFDKLHLCTLVVGLGICLVWVFTRSWIANNIIGISVCIEGIASLKLPSYFIGAALLVGLFFYDIFWVFGTVVMVTVAKGLDLPVKLLFPKENFFTAPYSMLGLGDIVIPGIFVALCLRFDVEHRKSLVEKGGEKEDQSNTVFKVTLIGYFLGMLTTNLVMHTFKAAQPALLYLVPFCILFSLGAALYKKQFFSLFYFRLPEVIEQELREKAEKIREEAEANGDSNSEPKKEK